MNQFLFDQDTGGAIRTAGRADLYMGVGPSAEEIAGRIHTPGQMYYLFLK
jgi:membrane-bound lytic murein transglycosylase A